MWQVFRWVCGCCCRCGRSNTDPSEPQQTNVVNVAWMGSTRRGFWTTMVDPLHLPWRNNQMIVFTIIHWLISYCFFRKQTASVRWTWVKRHGQWTQQRWSWKIWYDILLLDLSPLRFKVTQFPLISWSQWRRNRQLRISCVISALDIKEWTKCISWWFQRCLSFHPSLIGGRYYHILMSICVQWVETTT